MTPNAKRVAAYQKRQSEKVARMKAALERIAVGDEPRPLGKRWSQYGHPSKHDQCTHGVWMYETCGGCVSEFAFQALAPTDGRGEG